jgi:methionyl-tRNA formyltransferase
MRIVIFTQEENVYLPDSFARVCAARPTEIVCIISAPPMSTHGGPVKGFLRHVRLFGLRGTLTLGLRVLRAKLLARLTRPGTSGPFYSIPSVAAAFGIPYHYVEKVKGAEFLALLDRYQPDLLISISCPQIIGKKVRERFSRGCINVHGAPLPRYRGLMPAFWALRNGEVRTAATVHDLADKLDNGEILVQREVEITPQDTWDHLVRKTKAAGVDALLEAIAGVEHGTIERKPNPDSESTYFSFPTAADRREFLAAGRRFF